MILHEEVVLGVLIFLIGFLIGRVVGLMEVTG